MRAPTTTATLASDQHVGPHRDAQGGAHHPVAARRRRRSGAARAPEEEHDEGWHRSGRRPVSVSPSPGTRVPSAVAPKKRPSRARLVLRALFGMSEPRAAGCVVEGQVGHGGLSSVDTGADGWRTRLPILPAKEGV